MSSASGAGSTLYNAQTVAVRDSRAAGLHVAWPAPTFGSLGGLVLLALLALALVAAVRRRWNTQAMSLHYEDIVMDDDAAGVLGMGAQGAVRRGVWRGGPVAVKRLLPQVRVSIITFPALSGISLRSGGMKSEGVGGGGGRNVLCESINSLPTLQPCLHR